MFQELSSRGTRSSEERASRERRRSRSLRGSPVKELIPKHHVEVLDLFSFLGLLSLPDLFSFLGLFSLADLFYLLGLFSITSLFLLLFLLILRTQPLINRLKDLRVLSIERELYTSNSVIRHTLVVGDVLVVLELSTLCVCTLASQEFERSRVKKLD